jgi:DNA-directed RNA polymerase specialized sigma subunit
MDYKTFKNEISNYQAYMRSADEIKTELDLLWYELTGVKGIQYNKQPSSYNQELSESYRLELLDRIENKEKELDFTIMAIERYESELGRLPSDIRELVEQIFINGKTFAEVGKKVGYSDNGLHYKIKKEVEKI